MPSARGSRRTSRTVRGRSSGDDLSRGCGSSSAFRDRQRWSQCCSGAMGRNFTPLSKRRSRENPAFVNIGSTEGYYAVGLARRLPRSRVVAFDIDPTARHLCRRLASLNGVSDRVEVRGECDTAYLSTLPPGSVVLSDCEGAEKEILDPSAASALRAITVIVEVHDHVDPAISETLRARFGSTHSIEELLTRPRDPSVYPELDSYLPAAAARAVSEDRPGAMAWLVLRPPPRRCRVKTV